MKWIALQIRRGDFWVDVVEADSEDDAFEAAERNDAATYVFSEEDAEDLVGMLNEALEEVSYGSES